MVNACVGLFNVSFRLSKFGKDIPPNFRVKPFNALFKDISYIGEHNKYLNIRIFRRDISAYLY